MKPDCPSYLTLDSNPITINVAMRDQFGTQITGEFLDNNIISIVLSSLPSQTCAASFGQIEERLDSSSGYAVFRNLTFSGNQNSTCLLNFNASGMGIDPFNVTCAVILYGCQPGYGVHNGEPYDTCVASE